jgi:hypothetical protein
MTGGQVLAAIGMSMALVIALSGAAIAEERSGQMIIFGEDAKSIHMPVGNRNVWIEPAFEDYASMLFDVCDAMKISTDECLIYPMNGDLGGNAIATIVDGNSLVVYDRTLSTILGYEGAMAVIAHEVGHHYCGHIDRPPDTKMELEADRFAGGAMRAADYSLDSTLTMAKVFDERPSPSHPGRREREAAITAGWNGPEAAKACRRDRG